MKSERLEVATAESTLWIQQMVDVVQLLIEGIGQDIFVCMCVRVCVERKTVVWKEGRDGEKSLIRGSSR